MILKNDNIKNDYNSKISDIYRSHNPISYEDNGFIILYYENKKPKYKNLYFKNINYNNIKLSKYDKEFNLKFKKLYSIVKNDIASSEVKTDNNNDTEDETEQKIENKSIQEQKHESIQEHKSDLIQNKVVDSNAVNQDINTDIQTNFKYSDNKLNTDQKNNLINLKNTKISDIIYKLNNAYSDKNLITFYIPIYNGSLLNDNIILSELSHPVILKQITVKTRRNIEISSSFINSIIENSGINRNNQFSFINSLFNPNNESNPSGSFININRPQPSISNIANNGIVMDTSSQNDNQSDPSGSLININVPRPIIRNIGNNRQVSFHNDNQLNSQENGNEMATLEPEPLDINNESDFDSDNQNNSTLSEMINNINNTLVGELGIDTNDTLDDNDSSIDSNTESQVNYFNNMFNYGNTANNFIRHISNQSSNIIEESREKYTQQIEQMKSMGFSDENEIIRALIICDGNVEHAINYYLN